MFLEILPQVSKAHSRVTVYFKILEDGNQLEFLCKKAFSVARRVTLCCEDMCQIKELFNKLSGEDFVKRVSLFFKRATCLRKGNKIVETYTYHAGKLINCYILGIYLGENFVVSKVLIRPVVFENVDREKSLFQGICKR